MSTANSTPSSTASVYSVYSVVNPSLPPRERAFALHCQGYRSPAIAATLGVPERTVRAWLTRTLSDLAAEHAASRRTHQADAIARYQAISTAAWEGYARATALEIHTLEITLASSVDAPAEHPLADHAPQSPAESATSSSPSASACSVVSPSVCSVVNPSAPSASSVPSAVSSLRPIAGARYLAVALAADREICRLQGLYLPEATKPHQDVHIILERREPTAENYPPGAYPGAPTAAHTDPARDGDPRDDTPLGAHPSDGSLTDMAAPIADYPTPESPAESATPFANASVASVASVCSVMNSSAPSCSSWCEPSAPSSIIPSSASVSSVVCSPPYAFIPV